MKFKTKFDSHARVYQHPGSPVKTVYSSRYDRNGTLELFEDGQEDLYGYIQSHAESVDIHVLLKRFVNGETDVLSRAQGFYADASDMPKTYAEILNSVIAGEQAFNSLPAEVKQRFGNSFSQWMTSFEDPDFLQKMGLESPESPSAASQPLTPGQIQDFSGVQPGPSQTPSQPVSPPSS